MLTVYTGTVLTDDQECSMLTVYTGTVLTGLVLQRISRTQCILYLWIWKLLGLHTQLGVVMSLVV